MRNLIPYIFLVGFLFLFGCSEKAYTPYEPYTLVVESLSPKNKWNFYILDDKTNDQYKTYQKSNYASESFAQNPTKIGGLINENGKEIPFSTNTDNGNLVAIKDSMAYLVFSDPTGESDLTKTIQYKIGGSQIYPVDSIIQNKEQFEDVNFFFWNKACEKIVSRLISKTLYNEIETEITSLDPEAPKVDNSTGIVSRNGKFRITQKKCESIFYDEIISIPLVKYESYSSGIRIIRLRHVGNKLFFTFCSEEYINENRRLAWFDLKRKKLNIIKYPHWHLSPVLFDNSKKLLISKRVIPPKTDPCYTRKDFDTQICCYNVKSGKLEWQIELKRKDEFSSTIFETYLNQIIKLSENEIGIIYQRAIISTGVFSRPPYMIIINEKGEIKQIFEGKDIGGQLIKQEDDILRIVGRKSQQYLIRGEIKEGSKYELLQLLEEYY